MNIEFLLTYII